MSKVSNAGIFLKRGDTEVFRVDVTQPNGDKFDLSRIVRADLTAVSNAKVVLSLSTTDGTISYHNGDLVFVIQSGMTSDATWVQANYDLQLVLIDNTVKTVLEGVVTLSRDVTRLQGVEDVSYEFNGNKADLTAVVDDSADDIRVQLNPIELVPVGAGGKSITITGDRLDESGNRVLTFSDGKSITIPKGPKGDPGAPGVPGSDGLPGKAGEDGKSITITGDRLDESGNRVLTFSDGKSITIPKGPKGDPGAPGGGGQSLYDLAINRSLFAGDVDEFIKQILLFPMGIKDMQVGKVVRSTLEVVEGTGNARVWRVPFVRAFSEPPAVLMIENSTVYHGGSFLVYKVTERDFLIRSNYPAGDGMSICYLAFVPRN